MVNLLIGIALGTAFSAFFKMVWSTIKGSSAYQNLMSKISGKQ